VISQPDQTYGGVVQYDLVKNLGDDHKGFLKPPPTMLLTADHNADVSQVPAILADMIKQHPNMVKSSYGFPGCEKDCLYCSQCDGATLSTSCKSYADGKIHARIRILAFGTASLRREMNRLKVPQRETD
jgi:hypothetical protein